MKKLILAITAFISMVSIYAQPAKVVSAYNYLRYYDQNKKVQDLLDAQKNIDEAIAHEKSMNEAKTWYYRGNVYFAIANSKAPEFANQKASANETALKSYMKALVLNFKDPELQKLDLEKNPADVMKFFTALNDKSTKYVDQMWTADIIGQKFPYMANSFLNQGVDYFTKSKDYQKAMESFEAAVGVAALTGKVDTMSMYYTAMAAEKAGNKDKAIQLYEGLTQMKYQGDGDGPRIYLALSQLYKEKGDKDKSLKVLQAGRKAYPDDKNLILEELNHYLSAGKLNEALDNLNLAVSKDPNNHTLHFALGTVYDNLANPEKDKKQPSDAEYKDYIAKAEQAYKKAIEIKPDYFDAIYNLGALYFNQGVKINDAAQTIADNAKYAAEIKKADEKFNIALPYLEKALEIQPNDKNTLLSLKQLYARTGQTDKYKQVNEKLKN
ncbi:MAG: tetratricopeptide repeat protein [Bacteroidia bacterium]